MSSKGTTRLLLAREALPPPPEHLALISDVHANLEALEAVLADIERRGVREIWCLGDTLGYGPCPVECLLTVRSRCARVLLGNHDYAAVRPRVTNFSSAAASAIRCHRRLLREWSTADAGLGDLRGYLRGLPIVLKCGDVSFVHSSPRDPLWEYLYVAEAYIDCARLEGVFDFIEWVSFCGHTHFPGVVARSPAGEYRSAPAGEGLAIKLDREWKAYVNVGSVGQPRDSDPRATWVERRGDELRFHRVTYDYARTMARLAALPEIDPFCAQRLAKGR